MLLILICFDNFFIYRETTESSSSDEMVSAIAEASQTTFIKDRWEYTDFMGEMKYSIAGPTLPGSGNYLPYNIWGGYITQYR